MTKLRTAAACLLLIAATALSAQTEAVTVTVSGMFCESCASGIAAMLKRTNGVVKAEVSYEAREANVSYDPAIASPEKIVQAIEKMGYKAAIKK